MQTIQEQTQTETDLEFWIRKIIKGSGSKIVPTVEELNAFCAANGLISIEQANEAQYAAMQMAFLGVDTGEVEQARKSFYRARNLLEKAIKKAARRPRYKRLDRKKMISEIPEVRNLTAYLGILEFTRRFVEIAFDDEDDDFLDVEFFDE